MPLRVGSLFSGIGGLDLGLERAGMEVIWQSEIDGYALRVLAKHWPDIPNLGDIKTIDWSTVEPPDLICGGYPCQPFSTAGVRRGEDDPRHLWPFALDAIRHLRPGYVLLENVPGHLSLGFGRVLADLADVGYDAEWDCIPAAYVGAPHLRYRVFIVATTGVVGRLGRSNGGAEMAADTDVESGEHGGAVTSNGGTVPSERFVGFVRGSDRSDDVADTDGMARSTAESLGRRRTTVGEPGTVTGTVRRGGGDGEHWAVEPDVGRVAHGVPGRVDRLRTLGNAVVPQVAELIGRRIVEAAMN